MWDLLLLQESETSDEVELLQRKLYEVSAELEAMKQCEAVATDAGSQSAICVVFTGFCVVCCHLPYRFSEEWHDDRGKCSAGSCC